MAKIEKIGNIQIVDNKEDKFFYFPMISMACTGSGYKKKVKRFLLSFDFFLFSGESTKNIPFSFCHYLPLLVCQKVSPNGFLRNLPKAETDRIGTHRCINIHFKRHICGKISHICRFFS